MNYKYKYGVVSKLAFSLSFEVEEFRLPSIYIIHYTGNESNLAFSPITFFVGTVVSESVTITNTKRKVLSKNDFPRAIIGCLVQRELVTAAE